MRRLRQEAGDVEETPLPEHEVVEDENVAEKPEHEVDGDVEVAEHPEHEAVGEKEVAPVREHEVVVENEVARVPAEHCGSRDPRDEALDMKAVTPAIAGYFSGYTWKMHPIGERQM